MNIFNPINYDPSSFYDNNANDKIYLPQSTKNILNAMPSITNDILESIKKKIKDIFYSSQLFQQMLETYGFTTNLSDDDYRIEDLLLDHIALHSFKSLSLVKNQLKKYYDEIEDNPLNTLIQIHWMICKIFVETRSVLEHENEYYLIDISSEQIESTNIHIFLDVIEEMIIDSEYSDIASDAVTEIAYGMFDMYNFEEKRQIIDDVSSVVLSIIDLFEHI